MSQEKEHFLEKYGNLTSKAKVLNHADSLLALLPLIDLKKKVLVAFDFDQTLTQLEPVPGITYKQMCLRGGEDSRKALNILKERGATLIVISAQPPQKRVLVSLRNELRRLKIANVFEIDEWDNTPLLQYLRSWGDNDSLSLKQLTMKLIALFILNTDRYPKDLSRIGFTNILFGESEVGDMDPPDYVPGKDHKLFYRLMHMDEEQFRGDWSAALFLKENNQDTLLCPVRCCWHYVQRTNKMRSEAHGKKREEEIVKVRELYLEKMEKKKRLEQGIEVEEAPVDEVLLPPPDFTDRLFLELEEEKINGATELLSSSDNQNHSSSSPPTTNTTNELNNSSQPEASTVGIHSALKAEHATDLMDKLLIEAKVEDIRRKNLLDDIFLTHVFDGVMIAQYHTLLAARYNKPQAIQMFMKSSPCTYDAILFVDDNSDNVMNTFLHFAQAEVNALATHQLTVTTITSTTTITTTTTTVTTTINSSIGTSIIPDIPEIIPPINEVEAKILSEKKEHLVENDFPTVTSVWYPPPPGGRVEASDEVYQELLLALSQYTSHAPSQ